MPTLALPRPPRGLAALFAAVTALSLAACGGGGSDPAPAAITATISPASGTLGTTQTIRVIFSATMNATSQVLGGTLYSGDPANVLSGWTTTTLPGDTLVLAPATPWTAGPRTLTVTAKDSSGRTLAAPIQASYTVEAAETCGPSLGACNNAADCGYTINQLATWTLDCFRLSFEVPATSACIQVNGVSAGCSDCTAAIAQCGVTFCALQCATSDPDNPFSGECATCVVDKCAADFLTCAGRTL